MSYIRVCRTKNNPGKLVKADEVDAYIKSQPDYASDPWFVSTFEYPEEALEYFEKNDNKIKGYTGKASTKDLYWDLDSAKDLEKVKEHTALLAKYLIETYDGGTALEVYFSGNKGFHVHLKTNQDLKPDQVKRITSKIAREAGISETYDSTVYNSTRIFRYPNTIHDDSKLWKIPLSLPELFLPIEDIKKLAEKPRTWKQAKAYPGVPQDISELVAKFDVEETFRVDYQDDSDSNSALPLMKQFTGDTPAERDCIKALQAGNFGPGERENALIRMASYYKNAGLTFEEVYDKLNEALEARSKIYDDLNPHSDSDTRRNVNSVFDPGWRGGMFSCKQDEFLQSKCSKGETCCLNQKPKPKEHNDLQFGVEGLIRDYIMYGDEAIKEFPKTGLANLDRFIKVRRQNTSIIAGAPGSGKTSAILEIMESLNKQKIYHMFFSLDMAASSLFEMIATRYTNYSPSQIEAAFSAKTRDLGLMKEIAKRVTEELPYSRFDVSTAVDLKHIERSVKSQNALLEDTIQVCFVDYAGRLMGVGGSSFEKASANALLANDVAKTTNTHIMFIAQTSRESGDHTTPIHSNRVSKDSSEWEANATFVISVWRPFGTGVEADDRYMHMFIGKNRTGPSMELYFNWNGAKRKITPLTSEELTTYSDLCTTHNKPLPNLRELKREEDEARAYASRVNTKVATEGTDHSPEAIKEKIKEVSNANTDNSQKRLPNNSRTNSLPNASKKPSRWS